MYIYVYIYIYDPMLTMGHYLVAPWNVLENRKMGVCINGGPQDGWFMMENPITMNDL